MSAPDAQASEGAVGEVAEWADLVAANPDDIRAQGWVVAVHNDYRLNGIFHTFWLFTKDGQAIKGEGVSDAEALQQVRARLPAAAVAASEGENGRG